MSNPEYPTHRVAAMLLALIAASRAQVIAPVLMALTITFGAPVHGQGIAPSSWGTIALKAAAIWALTGSMHAPRDRHTATLLQNGKVLVAGGYYNAYNANNVLASAELYDPATGTWSSTGSLAGSRFGHTATLLQNGKVLVAGGYYNDNANNVLATAELYDPATGTWSFTGSLTASRVGHTATLLPDGKVLVAGGYDDHLDDLAGAELYDPGTGTWSVTGNLNVPRYGHTATLLQNGNVLVVGGSNDGDLASTLSSVELYDPVAGTWSITGNLITARYAHAATQLRDGTVLISGGYLPTFPGGFAHPTSLNTAELYDPRTGKWSTTGSLNGARAGHSATLLTSGEVLVAGGYNYNSNPPNPPLDVNGAELYDPGRALWDNTSNLNVARNGHSATLLPSGNVLVTGGAVVRASAPLDSAELYVANIAPPPDNAFRITGLFSDQAGIYQYVQLSAVNLSATRALAGLTLSVTAASGVVKTFTFATNAPGSNVCVATQHVWPTPSQLDYVIPDGFLPTIGGTLNFAGIDSWTFGPFALNGSLALNRSGPSSQTGLMSCSNFAVSLTVPVDPVIEYYNAGLDHYFMSASQPDLDALDSGRIAGWVRTGQSFNAWITREVPTKGVAVPPNLLDVCRLYIPPADGNSHFYSASAPECAAAQAQHPEFIVETPSAFLATLPDPQTGACPAGQTPIYRLWNGRADSNHRFTASIDIRDQMVARRYIPEGYGPNAVTLCAAGSN